MKTEWTADQIQSLLERQKAFFRSNVTLDVNWRLTQLKNLKKAVTQFQPKIEAALAADLGRSPTEAYFSDIGSSLVEINEAIHGLKRWAKPETHFSGLMCFPSIITKVYKMPFGNTLIISPYNFPILLSLAALTASLAGGNTAVIKASSKSPTCTAILKEMIASIFPPEYVAVVDGGHDMADLLLATRFDKIFYTGSPKVASHVLSMAAGNLTPVTLELGGETGNWCVIRADADLKDAARKIAFFKLCNSGQICININQVAVAEEVADVFLSELKMAFEKQIGEAPLQNKEYPHLITPAAFDKCRNTADTYKDRILFGGHGDSTTLRFEPTIIFPVSIEEDIVQHELFSPLLPVVPYSDREIDQLLSTIADREHGLAFYLFTKDLKWAKRIMSSQQYGGGCINEVCLQLMAKNVPFNGTGHSGMGAYHGEWGFREFTHPSTVLIGSNHGNLPLREHPYNGKKNAYKKHLIQWLER